VIHAYTEGEAGVEEWTKVKHVPKERALAYIDGSWKHKVRWRRATESKTSGAATPVGDRDWATLIDLSTLHIVPKTVRPLEKQLPNESRRLWEHVTSRLLAKEYSDATKYKHAIEQKQRDDAAERKRKGVE
jgi:oxysterol-binding protein-related protein 9/10/11